MDLELESKERIRRELFESKKNEVINKFSEKISKDEFLSNVLLNKIVMSLIYGNNPYSIIEQLIDNQEQLIKEMHEMKRRGSAFIAFSDPELGKPYEK